MESVFSVSDDRGTRWSWGVDSSHALTMSQQGLKLPIFVKKYANRTPAFWGRYVIGPWGPMTSAEIQAIRSDPDLQIPIVLLDGSPTLSSVQGSGEADATKCIMAAASLGVPRGVGLCIFGDIESQMSPTEEWIKEWATAFAASGYVGGLYGNATRASFSEPFNSAFVSEPAVRRLLFYASHLEYKSSSEWGQQGKVPVPYAKDGFPTVPSSLAKDANEQFVMWQYVENCAGGLLDYDLMTDKGIAACWKPWTENQRPSA